VRQVFLDFHHVHDHSRFSVAVPHTKRAPRSPQNYHYTGGSGSPGGQIVTPDRLVCGTASLEFASLTQGC